MGDNACDIVNLQFCLLSPRVFQLDLDVLTAFIVHILSIRRRGGIRNLTNRHRDLEPLVMAVSHFRQSLISNAKFMPLAGRPICKKTTGLKLLTLFHSECSLYSAAPPLFTLQ